MAEYVLGEMFSGPGGIAKGAEYASGTSSSQGGSTISHGWAVEYHPDTARTYMDNIPGAGEDSVFTADVREFDLRKVPRFDAFAFGFPCNDFSTVGEHRGLDGDYGALYTFGVHALALHSPKWFIAENVSGLSQANGGTAFGKILSALRKPGDAALTDSHFIDFYGAEAKAVDLELEYVLVAHLYKFEEYGLPQKRHRFIITGIRRDIWQQLHEDIEGFDGFKVPKATTRAKRAQKTAKEAIEEIPIPADAPNHNQIRHTEAVKARLAAIAPGKNAFNTEFDDDSLRLNVKGATLSNIYRRLAPNEPSYTVTGSGGGGTHMYHWSEHRALTNRERARLQTFPDDFEFFGGNPSVRRQVGMAVPPEGAQVILEAMLKTLDGIEYPSEDAPSVDVDRLISAYAESQAPEPPLATVHELTSRRGHGDQLEPVAAAMDARRHAMR